MKNFAITIFTILIVVILGLYLVSFQVRQTESCIVITFGKAGSPITEPGWYFKWPFPIQQVAKYDSRMKVYAPEAEETPTAGGEPIIVNSYVVWRIFDPALYYNATKKISNPENEVLRSRIRNTQNNVIGRHNFAEFVNSDPSKIKFETIEEEMLQDLQKASGVAQYGIEIKALGIKQLKVSEEVSKAVFNRMKSERNFLVEQTTSEGEAAVSKIDEEARKISEELTAATQARAKDIMGKGDAAAAKYYSMLDADPKLANFLRARDALVEMLQNRTTLALSADIEPLTLLRGIPKLKPVDPNESKITLGNIN